MSTPGLSIQELRQRVALLPRINLAHLPTPLEEAPRFAQQIGEVRVFIKRDDCTGMLFGGNKTRHNEFILADAVRRGADMLVWGAGVQSNNCRQTAAACAKLGLECHLFLSRGNHPFQVQGNLLLDYLAGAHVEIVDEPIGPDLDALLATKAAEFKRQGRRPYVWDRNQVRPLGATSYALCMAEIVEQTQALGVQPAAVYISSAGATGAGMALGRAALGLPYPVRSICPIRWPWPTRDDMADLSNRAAKLLNLPHRLKAADIEATEEYIGGGYGILTREGWEAIDLLARHEGILLDPVYTGKAMAALIDDVRHGRIAAGQAVVFVHTGGQPAVFAYSEELLQRSESFGRDQGTMEIRIEPRHRRSARRAKIMPGPRILVLSAAVGAGHLRAAQAVELTLRQVVPDATVKSLDVLELTNSAFRRFYGKAYLDLVNRAPHVLGYFYDLMDTPSRSGRNRGDRLRLALEKLNLRPFIRFLQAEPWDLVFNTHFLPAEIISALRKQERLQVPQVTVCTDFETHRLWVNQPCEHYFTATDEGAEYLHHWGVPREQISATGIPIHPVFSTPRDRVACLRKHDLVDDRPTILQMAGGFGVGPIEKLYRAILEMEQPLQVIVVTGRNEQVKAQLEAIPCPPRHRRQLLGFTTEIEDFMTVADLVMTKPGGLTTSETLACGAAMIIVNPTPGQETRNSDYLLENGAAIKVNNIATLAFKVRALLREPERLQRLKANARKLARPRAAFDVVERSLKLLGKRPGG